MKKINELIMWTLLFACLAGIGLMGGIFAFVAVAHLIGRLIA